MIQYKKHQSGDTMSVKTDIFIKDRADPFVTKGSDGWYYFTASVPAYDCIVLRRAKSLTELQTAEEHVIWHKHESGPMSEHIWAPEIHYLFGKRRQYLMMLNNIPLLNADIVTGISIMLIFSIIMRIPGLQYIFGFPTMLVAHVYFCLPYVILNVLPKLKEIDPNMMDAALDLGLKPHKALIKVIVPAIKSGIFAGLIFAFTMSFDDFVISYYTTGNGFNNLSIWIYSSIGRKSLKPQVYAFSTLITFGAMAILLICNFLSGRKGAKYGKKK